jgi:hypothetical protein
MKLTRRTLTAGLTAATASMLTSCGTIIYPERRNVKEHSGQLDFIVVGMDGVGLLFFLIPGIIAFVVDFGTGAIYLPKDYKKGKRERTIFDEIDEQVDVSRPFTVRVSRPFTVRDVEQLIASHTGRSIQLTREMIRTTPIEHLDRCARGS